jgi:hypothetical protein
MFIGKNLSNAPLACYLLAEDIRLEIKDPELKRTQSNLKKLKDKLGKKKFEKL